MINLLARLGYLKLVGKVVKDSVAYKNHVSFIETFFRQRIWRKSKTPNKASQFPWTVVQDRLVGRLRRPRLSAGNAYRWAASHYEIEKVI